MHQTIHLIDNRARKYDTRRNVALQSPTSSSLLSTPQYVADFIAENEPLYSVRLERIREDVPVLPEHSPPSPQATESDHTPKEVLQYFLNLKKQDCRVERRVGSVVMNGGGGIRTHGSGVSGEGETRSADYKSAALDRSATPPQESRTLAHPAGG